MVSAALIISSGMAMLEASACSSARMVTCFMMLWYTGFCARLYKHSIQDALHPLNHEEVERVVTRWAIFYSLSSRYRNTYCTPGTSTACPSLMRGLNLNWGKTPSALALKTSGGSASTMVAESISINPDADTVNIICTHPSMPCSAAMVG